MSQLEYAAITGLFEAYMTSHPPYGTPDSLYVPIRYINELGGKRVRPAMLLMAYNLWQEDVTPALPAAMAVEYFHNFSLMHDDIMDEAPLRRGRETVHQKFGRNAGILSGDAMLIRCFDLLLQAGERSGIGATLCSLMCKAALEICEGQQMDMDFEALSSPTEAEYLEMIRKKTACLLGISLQMGALLAGAVEEESMALYQFGEALGLGFQVQDDYLDTFGDAQLTGKQRGGDILRGKKNFLFVRAYSILPPPEQAEFGRIYEKAMHHQDIREVLQWYQKLHIDGYVDRTQKAYFAQAVAAIESLSLPQTTALQAFGQLLVQRSH